MSVNSNYREWWTDSQSKTVIIGSIAVFACFVWTGYRWKRKRDQTFYSIRDVRDCPHLLQQTKDLLHSEWKNQMIRHPTLDTDQRRSVEPLPCHRILYKTEPTIWSLNETTETVIGHVCLSKAARALSPERLRTMLKIGMRPNVIRDRAKSAGIDLNEQRFYDQDGNLTFDRLREDDFVKEISVESLVVDARHRRKGFAKLLLSESLLFVRGLGFKKTVGWADRKLVPFYEHLGAMKEYKEMYTTNTIVTEIDEKVLGKCRNTVQHSRYRLQSTI